MNTVPTVETDYGEFVLQCPTIATFPDQIATEQAQKGFILNLLVVGRKKLGAAVLLNSLFEMPLVSTESNNINNTTINEIFENNLRFRITVTRLKNKEQQNAINYIKQQYISYYENEQEISGTLDDTRIHACLYLLPGDVLFPEELQEMKLISDCCNLIPILTKADSYTVEELAAVKERLCYFFNEYQINSFPYNTVGQNMADENISNPGCGILATIASEDKYEIGGAVIRGRKYPWGIVDAENEEYSDFIKLRKMLQQTHYVELVEKTNEVFYNNIRAKEMFQEMEDNEKASESRQKVLRAQLEDVIEQKHRAIIDELRREEAEIDKKLQNCSGKVKSEDEDRMENDKSEWSGTGETSETDKKEFSTESEIESLFKLASGES